MLPEVEVVTTNNGTYYALFKTRDYISNSIRKYGHFEKKTQEMAKQFIKDGVVLDVGSNLGSFTIPLAKEFTSAKFIGFEPQHIVYEQFKTNVFLNSLINVECYNTGLAEKTMRLMGGIPDYKTCCNVGGLTLDFYVEKHKSNTITGKFSRWDFPTIYDVKSLDEYKIRNIDLIKIDVEGMELNVLRGAIQTLEENNYPPLIFECWQYAWFENTRLQLFTLLQKMGYKIEAQHKNNYLARK